VRAVVFWFQFDGLLGDLLDPLPVPTLLEEVGLLFGQQAKGDHVAVVGLRTFRVQSDRLERQFPGLLTHLPLLLRLALSEPVPQLGEEPTPGAQCFHVPGVGFEHGLERPGCLLVFVVLLQNPRSIEQLREVSTGSRARPCEEREQGNKRPFHSHADHYPSILQMVEHLEWRGVEPPFLTL